MDPLTKVILEVTDARGLKDGQVGKLAGISQAAVWYARKGQTKFSTATLQKLAKACGLRWALIPDAELVAGPRRDPKPVIEEAIPEKPLRGNFRFPDPVATITREVVKTPTRTLYCYLDGRGDLLLKSPVKYVSWWRLQLPLKQPRCVRMKTTDDCRVPDDVAPPAWFPYLTLEEIEEVSHAETSV